MTTSFPAKDLPSPPALRLKSLLKIKSAVSAGRTESLQPKLSNRLLSAPKSKLPTPVSTFRLPTARTVGSTVCRLTAGGDNKGVQVRLESVPCVTCLVQECAVLPSGQRSRKLPFDELKLHSQGETLLSCDLFPISCVRQGGWQVSCGGGQSCSHAEGQRGGESEVVQTVMKSVE